MDTHIAKATESQNPPPDLANSHQITDGSSPNCSPLPNEQEIQENQETKVVVLEAPNSVAHEEVMDSGPSYCLGIDDESANDEEQDRFPELPADTKPLTCYFSGLVKKRAGSISPVRVEEKPYMVGAGLANLGNTCFLNAVMQCFTHTVTLVKGLLSFDHVAPCERNENGFCLLCTFRDHVLISLASSGRAVQPWKFVDNLSYLSSSFQRYQQEDAHEFLQCFLDRLDSCCSSESKTKAMILAVDCDNFVEQSFSGRLVSKLKCCNCDHYSYTYEPSIDLSLEIEDVNTLNNALESFTKVERIEDSETKFTCEKCKEEVSIEKQLILEKAPSVATFHLKRFKNEGSFVEKIDKRVEFPLELNLQPFTSSSQHNNVELKYDLYAIVVHIGCTSTSGHYYSIIRSAPDTWYKFDDSEVVRVPEDYVLSQEAYILFYAKQGTTWFSSYMETLKPLLDPQYSNTSPKSVLENVEITKSPGPETVTNNHDVNNTSYGAGEIIIETPKKSRHDSVFGTSNESATTVPLDCSNSADRTSKTEKVFSPSVLREKSTTLDEAIANANDAHQTPPRSPSPDLYKEESPEEVFTITRTHLNMAKQLSCKKQLKKEWEGSETKEARRLCKSLPAARGKKLLAFLNASHGEETQKNKPKKRVQVRPHNDESPSRKTRKADLQSFMRPLAT